MKLVGLSYQARNAPGDPDSGFFRGFDKNDWGSVGLGLGHLALADSTLVFGPNDSGKSRLLSLLDFVLAPRTDPVDFCRTIVFAECSPDEFEALTAQALGCPAPFPMPGEGSDDEEPEDDPERWWQVEPLGPNVGPGHFALSDETDATTQWRDHVLAQVGENREAWGLVLDAATEGARAGAGRISAARKELRDPILALERCGDDDRGWRLFWSLPAFEGLPPELKTALTDCGLRGAGSTSELWADRWASGQAPGTLPPDWHRRLVDAPVIVAPLGSTWLAVGPAPMRLPMGVDALESKLEEQTGEIAEVIQDTALLVELASGEVGEENGESEPEPIFTAGEDEDDHWIEKDPAVRGGWRVSEDVARTCSLVQAAAALVLDSLGPGPRSPTARYSLEVRVRDPREWREHPRIEVRVREISAGSEEGRLPFELDELAEGYKLWAELAALQATSIVRRRAAALTILSSYVDIELENTEWHEEFEEAVDRVAKHLADFREGDLLTRQPEGLDLSRVLASSDWAMHELLELVRGTVYILDEPERHLHPKLQRQAAGWIENLASAPSAQVVAATHSVQLLARLSQSTALNYVSRTADGPTTVRQVTSGDFQATTEIGMDLGLDRGELLSLYEVFLFVEGPTDAALLSALFAEELRANGILVIPISGKDRGDRIVDAILLAQITSATLAVWLDNVRSEVASRLMSDPRFAASLRNRKKDYTEEELSLAKLVEAVRARGPREVVLLDNPARDAFFHLSDTAIEKAYPEAKWPGKDEAWELFHAQRKHKQITWRNFAESTFGIDPKDPQTYERVGRLMVDELDEDSALRSLLQRCVELGREARAGDVPGTRSFEVWPG